MLDLVNRKLLYELNWEARQTHSTLAKKLKVSKQVVSYRVKQLEEKKIIQSYHAVIDWRRLGYNAIRIYVKWHDMNLDVEKEVHRYIKEDPLFMWAIRFEGEFDLGFYVWVDDVQEFAKKWFVFISKYKKYIQRHEIYEIVDMIHYPMKFLLDKAEEDELIIGRKKATDYDEIDYEILKCVTRDGRSKVTEIAKKINLSSKAVIHRLRNLEKKGIILGYYTLIDETKLGSVFYKVDFYLKDMGRVEEMNTYAKLHPNVVYRMRTIGGPDFEIEIVVKDVIEMKKVVDEIRKRFPDMISHYRFHRFDYSIKQIYLPGESLE